MLEFKIHFGFTEFYILSYYIEFNVYLSKYVKHIIDIGFSLIFVFQTIF